MNATTLAINSRQREHPGVVASIADFEWTANEAMDAARLLDDRRFTLYCLDHARQRAIFTATPAGLDFSEQPFMYQAQFGQAEFLVALPYAEFLRLAEDMAPPSESLVCLHNIGRCGSTVLCRALNKVAGVMSLSEPDVLTNFVSLRASSRAEQVELLRACVAWLCRPAIMGEQTRTVLKFRNQAAGIMDLYVEALPGAAHLFMYRNVINWLASIHRFRVKRGDVPSRYSRAEVIRQQAAYYQCDVADFKALAHPSIETYLSLEGRALGWLYSLEQYLKLVQRGAGIAAIRYEDLQANREAVLRRVLARMGLPESALVAAERAFASDAQAGTPFAQVDGRGNRVALPAEMVATVERLLERQGVIDRADFVLPGTVGTGAGHSN